MVIPEESELLQEGLWVHRYEKYIGSIKYTFGALYSEDSYCFYEADLPEEERAYMQYRSLTVDEAEMSNEELSPLFVSMLITPDTVSK